MTWRKTDLSAIMCRTLTSMQHSIHRRNEISNSGQEHLDCTCMAATSLALMAATIASAFQQSFLHLMQTRTGWMYSCKLRMSCALTRFKQSGKAAAESVHRGPHQLGNRPLIAGAIRAEYFPAHPAQRYVA
jgi:hypothetical protein